MLTEATFKQTNFDLFFHLISHILVLISYMFIFVKVGHSKFVKMHEDASDFYHSPSKCDWYFIYSRHRF